MAAIWKRHACLHWLPLAERRRHRLGRLPHLSGQHAQYVTKQLTDFREGNRTNDGDAMTMRSIAGKLSNKDIDALASYIQGLH